MVLSAQAHDIHSTGKVPPVQSPLIRAESHRAESRHDTKECAVVGIFIWFKGRRTDPEEKENSNHEHHQKSVGSDGLRSRKD